MTMPARAARTAAARRSVKRKTAAAAEPAAPSVRAGAEPEPDDWMEVEEDSERLQEGEMEILLTGHAATHGIEGEDNWLIETEEEKWGER
jgi:hypothetical protein